MADPSPAKGRQLKIGRLVSMSVILDMCVTYMLNPTAYSVLVRLFPLSSNPFYV